jgi:hypothetical protein
MPSSLRPLVVLRGEPEYAEALERLRAAEGAETVNRMIERLVERAAKRRRIPLPPRARRPGTWAKTGTPRAG